MVVPAASIRRAVSISSCQCRNLDSSALSGRGLVEFVDVTRGIPAAMILRSMSAVIHSALGVDGSWRKSECDWRTGQTEVTLQAVNYGVAAFVRILLAFERLRHFARGKFGYGTSTILIPESQRRNPDAGHELLKGIAVSSLLQACRIATNGRRFWYAGHVVDVGTSIQHCRGCRCRRSLGSLGSSRRESEANYLPVHEWRAVAG